MSSYLGILGYLKKKKKKISWSAPFPPPPSRHPQQKPRSPSRELQKALLIYLNASHALPLLAFRASGLCLAGLTSYADISPFNRDTAREFVRKFTSEKYEGIR